VVYEQLPAVFDPDEAMRAGAPVLHDYVPDNMTKHVPIRGARRADVVAIEIAAAAGSRQKWLEVHDRLIEHFCGRRSDSCPIQKIVAFAILSTRRQEEITLLRWDDLDGDRILVRAMKDPQNKPTNDVLCELTPEALAIIESMPRTDVRIFPFSADAISASFTRACQLLGIDDLHFHDLRHEGISRLFEMARTIPQVATVSGHKSWSSLKRDTHIRQTGDKYAGWKWLGFVTAD
jgi:integrase